MNKGNKSLLKKFQLVIGILALATVSASPLLAQDQFTPGMRSVKIAVDDFDKSIAFYQALGMKLGTSHRPTVKEMVWENGTYNSGVMMVAPEYAAAARMTKGGTYLMITSADVYGVVEKLHDAGFLDIGEPKVMGEMVTILMLKDPDGNTVELMGPPPAKLQY